MAGFACSHFIQIFFGDDLVGVMVPTRNILLPPPPPTPNWWSTAFPIFFDNRPPLLPSVVRGANGGAAPGDGGTPGNRRTALRPGANLSLSLPRIFFCFVQS